MNAVLPAFFTVGAGMGLIYWITKRRELVAESLENDKDRNVSENS